MLGWASQGGNWFDGVWEEVIISGGDVSVKVFENCGFGEYGVCNLM